MIKNKKLALVTCLAALGIGTNANAAMSGLYVGGQLGGGNVHERGVSSSQLADAINDAGLSVASSGGSSKETGVAGRLFAGYQFNDNFAAELGYSKFSNAKSNAYATGVDSVSSLAESVSIGTTTKSYAVDLVGKAILPLQNCFNVYGKLGVAYLNERVDLNVSDVENGVTLSNESFSASEHKVLPTFGVGAGYEINQNLAADLSWNHIQKVGNTDLTNKDMIALGLTYRFG